MSKTVCHCFVLTCALNSLVVLQKKFGFEIRKKTNKCDPENAKKRREKKLTSKSGPKTDEKRPV